jgi:hypothetical protein
MPGGKKYFEAQYELDGPDPSSLHGADWRVADIATEGRQKGQQTKMVERHGASLFSWFHMLVSGSEAEKSTAETT